jgi:DNA-directed RNA polymerase subunit M/transcription elongation factor TFIIS
MPEKTFKQVCKCESCGNEAEMQITCTLEIGEEVVPPAASQPARAAADKKKVEGRSVCSHCGNEADLWVEVE